MALLELKNLHVALEDGTEIVKGVDLSVDTNQIHAIMGPNGSGKTTLAYALMGPLIPLVLFVRHARTQQQKGNLGRYMRAAPAMALLLIAWTTGEVWGYLTKRA